MIRKFVVTNNQSTQSTGSGSASDTDKRSMASPTSQIDSNIGEDGKKLYAQSLESTENSIVDGLTRTNGKLSTADPMLYPIGSDEHATSTDEGLSMSEEEEDQIDPQNAELTKLINDLDIDHKLKSAAQRGDTELVKELLCNGAQVITDENGSTAIHVAAQNGFAEVVRLLLEHGTDVDIPDDGGYTALHKAAGNGHLDVLELLINEGCDIDTQDDTYGNTPLHEAAWHGFSKSVDLLLKNKSNAFITNRAGCTPLHLATQNGHNQSGRTLLYGGCSPDVKNNYGDTPLHTAARYGHAGIARILISAKCSIAEQNKNGDTALHITSAFKRRKIAKLLVEAGVATLIRNKQDETAVDIARRKDHLEIIEIIHQTSQISQPMYESNRRLDRKQNKLEENQDPMQIPYDLKTDKTSKAKSHNSFVSWIRKKILKKPPHSPKVKTSGSSQQVKDADGDVAYNNQYVKKSGFAYYRDLAGNIRQGPCGFVPACHCEPNDIGGRHTVPPTNKKEMNYAELKETQILLSDKMADLKLAADKHKYQLGNDRTGTEHRSGLRSDGNNRDMTKQNGGHVHKDQADINRQLAQVENDLQELRGDLKTWLQGQTEEGTDPTLEENPFAYASGVAQTRFGDDFDHERMARYEVTEQFPPPPRLFRSRSDETLSHSEYSYHGRAFKSKEAAMEELKTLKHHEELRAQRRKIRARGDDHSPLMYERSEPRTSLHKTKSSTSVRDNSNNRSQINRSNSSRPNLWQSRENIRHDRDISKERGRVEGAHQADKPTSEGFRPVPKIRQITNTLPPNPSGVDPIASRTYGRQYPLPAQQQSNVPPHQAQTVNYHTSSQMSARPPATYRLISAALKNPNTQNSEPMHSYPPPVPAQRSHNTAPKSVVPNISNYGGVRPSNLPFDRHQGQSNVNKNIQLYSESQSNPTSHSNTEFQRPSADNCRQYNSIAVTDGSLVYPQAVNNNRRHLPSYDEVKDQRQANVANQIPQFSRDNMVRSSKPQNELGKVLYKPHNTRVNPHCNSDNVQGKTTTGKVIQPVNNASLLVHIGESCCGSSNPDSGYGGQPYDFYTSQPSPQQTAGKVQAVEEYDTSWYNRRLQDASRKMNTTHLRPPRTMTSDV